MKETLLSARYAKAFADVVEKDGQLPQVRSELLALARGFSTSPGLQAMLSTASKSRQEKKAFFRKLSRQLGLSEHTTRLLEHLVERKRAALVPALAESFAQETDRRLGIRRAQLIAAMPLSEEQKSRIIEKLERISQAKVELEETVDESLIAGFQVRLDGRFCDASLRGQLQRIRETLTHGARSIHPA